MRTLEILMSIALVPVALDFRRRTFAALALALMLLHLGMEGYRWQMIPAYLLAVTGLLRTPARTIARVARVSVSLAALAAGSCMAIGNPVFRDPAPSGPYTPGTTRLYLVDATRHDRFAPNPNSPRELLVVAWYPAEVAAGARPEVFWPDAPAATRALAPITHLPPWNFLQHLRLVKTHSYRDAPVARARGPYPVLIFSHGYLSSPWQNTVQMEELASHGFVVFSVGHTYEAGAVEFPDGRVAPFNLVRAMATSGESPEAQRLVAESLAVWVADTRFVVDELAKINAAGGQRFSNRLDLARLGVFGMSFGGPMAVEFCLQDSRCKAGVNLDGHQPDPGGELSVPLLYFAHEGTGENDAIYARSRGDLYRVQVRGAAHGDFSDVGLVLPILKVARLLGPIDARKMERIMNAYLVAFFEKYLDRKPSPLLDGRPASSPFPEVVFTNVRVQ